MNHSVRILALKFMLWWCKPDGCLCNYLLGSSSIDSHSTESIRL